MPARRLPAVDTTLCRRCQLVEPTIVVRTEPLCQTCFRRYVETKVVKRMETFRVRNSEPGQERKLLLALSFGVCSTALLHILSQHLKGQAEKARRTGFRLHVVHVDDSTASMSTEERTARLEQFGSRYSEHEFHMIDLSATLSSLSLSDMLPPVEHGEHPLAHTLESTPSATSRADLLALLTRKALIAHATSTACEALLWGTSTTTLAERTLAETAKGRGASLPWSTADGATPYAGMPMYHPLRNLLTKELTAYVACTSISPPLTDLVQPRDTKPSVSVKHTTIDELMRQYFASVEADFPSIVANVVKTTGKLQTPSVGAGEAQCELCEMPLAQVRAPERSRLCYACIRTLPVAVD